MKKYFISRAISLITVFCFIFSNVAFALPNEKQTSPKLRSESITERPDALSGLLKDLGIRDLKTAEEERALKAREAEFTRLANTVTLTNISGIDLVKIVKADLGNTRGAYHFDTRENIASIPLMQTMTTIVLNSNHPQEVQDEVLYHETQK